MIPTILIAAGALLSVVSLFFLIRTAVSPLINTLQIVFKRRDDYLLYETPKGRSVWIRARRQVTEWFLIGFIIGLLLILLGWVLGYMSKGDSFWLHKAAFGEPESEQALEAVDEDGRYVASDGTRYMYYVSVAGDKIRLNDEECGDLEDFEDRISKLRRENAVALIDNYAVSSTYRLVAASLRDHGFEAEEVR